MQNGTEYLCRCKVENILTLHAPIGEFGDRADVRNK